MMIAATAALGLLMQVGPNPTAGAIPGMPEELLDRPSRSAATAPAEADSLTSAWLMSCLELVDSDPARAHTQAQIRRDQTSGVDRVLANHCLGLASTGLARWDDAQRAFTAARDGADPAEQTARARFGAMAGNAALARSDIAGAYGLLNTARSEAQSGANPDLRGFIAMDLARALVAMERLPDADAMLAEARTLIPNHAETRLLSATLMRRMDRLAEAQVQIAKAAELAPVNTAIGLEAGVIAILQGRDQAARTSWQSVIDLDPAGDDARTARDYLAQLGPPASGASQ